jgi:periplasmic copper chaperone A
MKHRLSAAALLCLGFVSAGFAAEAPETGIAVTGVWSRATPPSASTGVLYLTVTDKGAADSLTAVSTPVAASAKIHESKSVDGVMQMRPVDAVPITAAAPLKFAPGGYHVMLEGLKQPLKKGDQFPVTLIFAHAGAVTVTADVQSLGASAPAGSAMDGMDMGHMGSGH